MQYFFQSSYRLYYILATAWMLCWDLPAYSQETWRSAGTLINDKSFSINIEFSTLERSCTDGVQSRYRYRILRRLAGKSTFIHWRFDYLNCDNELVAKDVKLHIGTQTPIGILKDPSFTFQGYKVIHDVYDVLLSQRELTRQAIKPVSAFSYPPRRILGDSTLAQGQQSTLRLEGGYLAQGSIWKWYEGSCSGRFLDTGRSVRIQATKNTVYFVRAEGSQATPCVAFPVKVITTNLAATSVNGRKLICSNEKDIVLSVNSGRLGDEGKWVWYENGCNGRKIGEGPSIRVSPATTTTYAVRAEGPTNVSGCQLHTIEVTRPSISPASIVSLPSVEAGAALELSVSGGLLASGAEWVWYTGLPNTPQRIGTGRVITSYPLHTTTYLVRAEGQCNSTAFAVKTVKIKSKPANSSRSAWLINAGVVADEAQHINTTNNYVFTLGYGGLHWGGYLRAKLSTEKAKSSFEAAADGHIDGYNQPGYYQYNGQKAGKRQAFTGGVFLGGKHLAVYLGGGYGKRQALAGLDQRSYTNDYYPTSSWVTETANSYSGWEVESGLLIRAGWFNLMGGVSNLMGKYTDYQLGVGLSF